MRIAAWIEGEKEAPPQIIDDSIQRLQEKFEKRSSPSSQTVIDICQKMASSFKLLRNEC